MEEGGRSRVGRLVSYAFALGGDGGATLARADAKSFVVSMRVVPAWPMGMLTNSLRPQYFLRAVSRGRYLSVLWVYFSCYPRSLQKPTSKRIKEQSFFLKASEDGLASTPRA